jgi:hypothetical protein
MKNREDDEEGAKGKVLASGTDHDEGSEQH